MKKAFTIIELLVVVSIISLMISILIPSLSNARIQTNTSICKSKLHSISQLQYIYFCDNDASFYNNGILDLRLRDLKKAYDVDMGVFDCPGNNNSPISHIYEDYQTYSYVIRGNDKLQIKPYDFPFLWDKLFYVSIFSNDDYYNTRNVFNTYYSKNHKKQATNVLFLDYHIETFCTKIIKY